MKFIRILPDTRQDHVLVLQLDAKHRVGQGLQHRAFHLDGLFLLHNLSSVVDTQSPRPPRRERQDLRFGVAHDHAVFKVGAGLAIGSHGRPMVIP